MNRLATGLSIAAAFAAGCGATHLLRPALAAENITAQIIHTGEMEGDALGSANAGVGYSITLLAHVFLIAFAGVVANRRLLNLLQKFSGNRRTARAVFFSWLAGNLFLGAQLAWNLRPFIGHPKIAVQFLRDDPLRGNFYEAVWASFRNLFL